jgi:hypothetical protein
MNKLLSTAFLLCYSLLSVAQYTISEGDVDFYDGEIYQYLGIETDIIIPEYLYGEQVTRIANNAFETVNLTSVILPSTLTYIGSYAFGYETIGFVLPYPYQQGSWNIGYPGEMVNNDGTEYFFFIENYTPEDFEFEFENGVLKGYNGPPILDLNIPTSINGELVTSIGQNAFNQTGLFLVVTIPEGVTKIEKYAFDGSGITAVSIPNTVIHIGDGAFSYCNLADLTIPNSVSYIGYGAFDNNELQTIILPENLSTIKPYSFQNNRLTSIIIPNSVTSIGREAFDDNNLSNVTFSNSLKSIGDKAFNENRLSNIVFPNSVIQIGPNAFSNNNLTSFVLPSPTPLGSWNRGNAGQETNYYGRSYNYQADSYTAQETDFVFENGKIYDYIGLGGNVIIPPTINGQDVLHIYPYSLSDKGFTQLNLPNTITRIYNDAITGNPLTDITIPHSVRIIGTRALNDNRLTSVTFGNGLVRIYDDIFGYIGYNDNDQSLLDYTPPSSTVSGQWFNRKEAMPSNEDDSGSEYIIMSENYIAQDIDFDFEDGEIKRYYGPGGDITIPETINGEKVTSIGSNFFASELTKVTLPNTVTNITYGAFQRQQLTSFILPTPSFPGTWNKGTAGQSTDVLNYQYVYTACSSKYTKKYLSTLRGECSVNEPSEYPSITDYCGNQYTGTTDVTFPITTSSTITWTYIDNENNIITQTQHIIINDQTDPVADVETLSAITAECQVTELTSPTATDNCSNVTVSHNAILPITESTTITWSYTDVSGNTTTQTQEIVINDVTSPTPDVKSLVIITSECEITSLESPSATDNCSSVMTVSHNAELPIITSTTIIWAYSDANGNQTTQTQQVTIQNNSKPILNSPILTTLSGDCEILNNVVPTATSTCGEVINGIANIDFPITDTSIHKIEWSYMDSDGNTISQTQDIKWSMIPEITVIQSQEGGFVLQFSNPNTLTFAWIDCSTNEIVGNSINYSVLASGSYKGRVSNGTCAFDAECVEVEVIVTSAFTSSNTNTLQTFPNPSSDVINIISNGQESFDVYNVSGVLLFSSESHQINIDHLNSGVYIIKQGNRLARFIKQ